MFGLKQKLNEIFPVTIKKIEFCLVKKKAPWTLTIFSSFVQTVKQITTCSNKQGNKNVKCKTKAIHKDLAIFTLTPVYLGICRHVQGYSGIFKNYSGVFRTLRNPTIFRNLIYSEPLLIQNQKHNQKPFILRNLVYSESEVYWEHWYIQNSGIFRNLLYSKPWHIQIPVIFRTMAYSKSCRYSEAEAY